MKNAVALVLFAFAVVACNSCVPQPSPITPGPTALGDAGPSTIYDAAPPPPAVPTDACGTAEAHAALIGCAIAPTINGMPWSTVCRAYMASGVDMHADCVTRASDCPTVSACLNH